MSWVAAEPLAMLCCFYPLLLRRKLPLITVLFTSGTLPLVHNVTYSQLSDSLGAVEQAVALGKCNGTMAGFVLNPLQLFV